METGQRITRSAAIISGSVFLSRVLGLVRDVLAARFIGSGWEWDAFVLAFLVPNLFRRIFGEGALTAAFLPVFSDYLEKRSRDETFRFMSVVLTLLAAGLGAITVVGIVLCLVAPSWLGSLVPNPEKLTLTLRLLAVMLPFLPLVCLVAVLAAILNCFKHFLFPALASVVLNLFWIAGFLVGPHLAGTPRQMVMVVAWAILVGGAAEFFLQLPALWKHGIRYRPALSFRQEGLREIAVLMGPVVFGMSILQITLLVDNVIAEACVPGEGAVSALYYGNRFMQFPLGLIGVALAQAAFPFLAEMASRGDLGGLRKNLEDSLRMCWFVAVPASVGLALLGEPLLRLFLEWERFLPEHTARASAVLAAYSLGVWAHCGNQLLMRAFYCLKDHRTVVRTGVAVSLGGLVLNLILVWYWQEVALAATTSLAGLANLGLLWTMLERRMGKLDRRRVLGNLGKVVLSSAVMAAVVFSLLQILPGQSPWQGAWGDVLWRSLRVMLPVLAGAGVYFLVARLLGLREVRLFKVPSIADKEAAQQKEEPCS